MNININTLLNNYGSAAADNSQNAQVVDSTKLTGTDAGLAMLQSLAEGDVINGQIIDINQNDILLQLAQGVSVKAQLADAFSLNIGDIASFIISDKSSDQITLKLFSQEFPANIINQSFEKSLKEAGLPLNDRNIELVQEFVKQNLPINKATLTEAARSMLFIQEATPEDIAYLTKMNIPITKESVEMIHNFYDFNSNMDNDIKDIADGIIKTVDSFAGPEAGKDTAAFIDKTIEIFNSGNANEAVTSTVRQEALLDFADTVQNVVQEYIDKNPEQRPVNIDTIEQKTAELVKQLKSGNVPAKEILHNLAELAKELPDTESFHKLFKSDVLKNMTSNMLRQELTIRPEEFNNDNLKKAYAKTLTSMHEMENLLNSISKKDSPLMQTMNGIARSTEFVNNLNNLMAYVQIPLKMSSQTACGQLHVYKRNKTKKDGPEEQTAMLHLDMEHLGKIDVFVKLCNNNLTTDFSVETEEILDFIEAHIPELSQRLEEQGYNVSITASSEQKETFNIKESVIKKENPPVEISRLSFDVRA